MIEWSVVFEYGGYGMMITIGVVVIGSDWRKWFKGD
jgi:hypothetical protein